MKTGENGFYDRRQGGKRLTFIRSSPASICICIWLVFLSSCSSKPTDMRALVPADSLVYLEANDLAAALKPLVDAPSFAQAARSRPDISGLGGVQLAVTVGGFEMAEEKLTDDYSVGRVRPMFVAIADTHAWNWGAVAFAESQIGAFVMDVYRSDVSQEKSEKHGGTFFTWSANDGRKAFALVIGSLVYFSNDESAIEKCLAVKRGEADAFSKTGKLTLVEPAASLASGFVSTEGVAQLANLAAISMASGSGEEADVQSAIAGILPQLVRGGITEAQWVSLKTANRIEDRYSLGAPEPVAAVLAETLAPTGTSDTALFEMIPRETPVVTSYDLEKPHVAWRSILLTSQSLLEPTAGNLIAAFSDAFAAPYGIDDPEIFLSGISSKLLTGNAEAEGDRPFVVGRVGIPANVRAGLSNALIVDKRLSDEYGFEVLRAEDEGLAAAFVNGIVIVGDADAVLGCLKARAEDRVLDEASEVTKSFSPGPTAATRSLDSETGSRLAALLSEANGEGSLAGTAVQTETRFTRRGIERKTLSEFGLIGSILANLRAEN